MPAGSPEHALTWAGDAAAAGRSRGLGTGRMQRAEGMQTAQSANGYDIIAGWRSALDPGRFVRLGSSARGSHGHSDLLIVFWGGGSLHCPDRTPCSVPSASATSASIFPPRDRAGRGRQLLLSSRVSGLLCASGG